MAEHLKILIADDEPIVHDTLSDYLKDAGHVIVNCKNGIEALKRIEAEHIDLALVDLRMPGVDGLTLLKKIQAIKPSLHVVIITGHGSMDTAIEALRLGAIDFLPKPVKLLELDAVLEKTARIIRLNSEKQHLKETVRGIQISEKISRGSDTLLGGSKAMTKVRQQIKQIVAAHVDRILISGETGTGKEVVARTIHNQALGDDYPFIAVNCPALPETLAESELFGHTKGAFTGASSDRSGYFELADGGTLFLDEISDLSAPIQAKLLRVLETGRVRPVGGSKEIEVSVRVIAATNVNLQSLIKKGVFRKDLFFRLNLFPVSIQPLRKRKDDILLLADYFLDQQIRLRKRQEMEFSEKSREVLLNYSYPGNVRELQNIVERAAIICNQKQISPEHLNIQAGLFQTEKLPVVEVEETSDERSVIMDALEKNRWNRRDAAKYLDMPYSTLRFKMTKLGIS